MGDSDAGLQKYVKGRNVRIRDWMAAREVSFWSWDCEEGSRDFALSCQLSSSDKFTVVDSSSAAVAVVVVAVGGMVAALTLL